uniref:Domain of unknown function DB domain-containing protein n=1 Tax=Acrobeloides nanus TaxID=290746 RepID=A0A914DY18_9BILA
MIYILVGCLLAFLTSLPYNEACFSSGCGPTCGPPPPPPIGGCGGGCSPGYACGGYGCYKVRAKVASSKTLKIDEDETGAIADRLKTPDEQFYECCTEHNLPDACLSKCSYRTYTRDALQNMYFRADQCPIQAASHIHYCAAQGRDHRQCCMRNGIASTLAGPKCLVFCDQRPGNVTQLDLTYLPCYDRFESMKGCFWHDVNQRAQRQFASRSFSESSLENEDPSRK